MAKKEFPKVVYGPGDETETILSWDEMPEGFMTFREKFWGEKPEKKAAPKKPGGKKPGGKKAAPKKDDDAAYRAKMTAFLDEHDVVYAADAPTDVLENLTDKLRDHLKAQEHGSNE